MHDIVPECRSFSTVAFGKLLTPCDAPVDLGASPAPASCVSSGRSARPNAVATVQIYLIRMPRGDSSRQRCPDLIDSSGHVSLLGNPAQRNDYC